jgi:hypothetical protein
MRIPRTRTPTNTRWPSRAPTRTFAPPKAAAKHTLLDEGYSRDNFTQYDVNDGGVGSMTTTTLQSPWPHGDGVMVYAVGASGERFWVELETVPNPLGATATNAPDCRVREKLFHVLQTDVDYNADRSGDARATHVEGSFRAREQARECALTALLDGGDVQKSDFAEYNVYGDGVESLFGPDVLVHAVNENGQNFLVSVVEE